MGCTPSSAQHATAVAAQQQAAELDSSRKNSNRESHSRATETASKHTSKSLEKSSNRKIEKEQQRAHDEEDGKVHLLILGTGDSGKTTLRKQIVNVSTERFKQPDVRKEFSPKIIDNLVDGTCDVLSVTETNADKVQSLRELRTKGDYSFMADELASLIIKTVFEDPSFAEMVQSKNVHVDDSFYPYAEQLRSSYPTWGGLNWIPSVEDCIRCRAMTTGVVKEEIVIDHMPIVIYDVGGQRSERRKWMHMFDEITAMIFVASMSEYDQVLFEDRSKNRLLESLEVFSDCINSSWPRETTALLFLNKKDLFVKKFCEDKIPLNASGLFPDAPTDHTDVNGAVAWMTKEFKQRKVRGTKWHLYTHVTTATDPENVRTVFKVCRETVLRASMQMSGFQLNDK